MLFGPLISMLLHYSTLFLALLFALARTLPSDPHQTGKNSILFPRDTPRDVSLLIDFRSTSYTTKDGTTVFPCHSALLVAGTNQEGPLKIEIADDLALAPRAGLNIRVSDLTPANTGKKYRDTAFRVNLKQMETHYTNKDFMDPETGKGLVADAWAQDHVYRAGPANAGNINTCNTFLQRLIEGKLGGRLTPRAHEFYDGSRVWTEEVSRESISRDVQDVRLETVSANGLNIEKKFVLNAVCGNGKSKRGEACNAKVSAVDDKPPTKVDELSQRNELAVDPIASSLPESELALGNEHELTDKAPPTDAFSTRDKETQISLARAGGTLTSFTAVSKEALGALGIAGTVAGAVFVIIDFVDHNWVGGAIGAVELAAGIAAGFALSGPLGWVVGGAIAVLFASTLSLSAYHLIPLMRTSGVIRLFPTVYAC